MAVLDERAWVTVLAVNATLVPSGDPNALEFEGVTGDAFTLDMGGGEILTHPETGEPVTVQAVTGTGRPVLRVAIRFEFDGPAPTLPAGAVLPTFMTQIGDGGRVRVEHEGGAA